MGRALKLAVSAILVAGSSPVSADPCGMVPPIVLDGPSKPITRVGLQKTYVYFENGIETMILRPGFTGKVDTFGMLIPFPTPPAIRKVADDSFAHIAKAIDPPEIVVNVGPRRHPRRRPSVKSGGPMRLKKKALAYDTVKVLRQEAVGMYQIAVLAAGSAAALERWMEANGYRYPKGMDDAANDYVGLGWCFVAVKTRVGDKAGVEARPGMKKAKPALPDDFTFNGHVQAMGFRFRTKQPVIPMRLSTFNLGELRNVVYLLTTGPKRIRAIPKEMVRRQIPGRRLYKNLTNPLPLRIVGGTVKDLRRPGWWHNGLAGRRKPEPHNGLAQTLFAGDLLAVRHKRLAHPHEEREKAYLDIGERLGLRGKANDRLIQVAIDSERKEILGGALRRLKRLTLSVVDGDFPREVLRDDNLTLASWRMSHRKNRPAAYHAPSYGPKRPTRGIRYEGRLPKIRR